jgi:futalosine hydrolase
MQLLLCAATEFEIGPTIELIRKENIKGVDVLITGIGLMASTYSLTRSVLQKKPDFILQAGIAGCLDAQLPLTKLVVVQQECIGDLGVEESGKFRSLFDMKLSNPDQFPWKNGRLSNDLSILQQTGLTVVNGVTINEISTNKERIDFYRREFDASVETMEGAALHYVALMEGIRFLQLRSLSNFAGERDKTKWVMDMALASLNENLQRILIKLVNQ